MNKFFFVFISLISYSVGRGQEPVPDGGNPAVHALSISLGADNFHVKDEYASPLIYRGTVFSASLAYRALNGNTRQTIEADFATGTLTSTPRQFDAVHYLGSISYTLLYRIYNFKAAGVPARFSIGGGIGSTFWISQYSTPATLRPNNRGDGYAAHGLAFALRAEAGTGAGGMLALQASTPLIRLVSRPAYGVVSDRSDDYLFAITHPYVEYFWERPIVQFQAEYTRPLSARLDFDAVYRFGFNACDEPLPMSAYSNTFAAGFSWKF